MEITTYNSVICEMSYEQMYHSPNMGQTPSCIKGVSKRHYNHCKKCFKIFTVIKKLRNFESCTDIFV